MNSSPSKEEYSNVLLRAAKHGDQARVEELLQNGMSVNTTNNNGLTALHLAVKEGYLPLCKYLLDQKIHVDAKSRKGNTALHIACLGGRLEIVQLLVDNGADLNAKAEMGFTPLYMASQENCVDIVKYLISKKADANITTEDGFTPLAVALQQQHHKVVSLLLEKGRNGESKLPALLVAVSRDDCKAVALLLNSGHNPEIASKSGFTAMHIAAKYGYCRIADLLIRFGASVDVAASKEGITPLHVACKSGRHEIVAVFIKNNVNLNSITRDQLTPLHCAARHGHSEVVDIMLQTQRCEVNCRTKSGLTPLHLAAQGDHAKASRYLIHHGIDVNDASKEKLTPLHISAHCDSYNCAKFLLEREANPNPKAVNGYTPLHVAVKKRRIRIILLLLDFLASTEEKTDSGMTPLHVAAYLGHKDCYDALIKKGANIEAATDRGERALHLAVRGKRYELVEALLKEGADVNSKATEDQTCLHISARLCDQKMTKILLNNNADVTAVAADGYQPLHVSVKEGDAKVSDLLIKAKAPLDTKTNKEMTPLHLAAKYNQYDTAKLLLDRGADKNAPGVNNLTPLHIAVHYSSNRVALLLIEYKVNVDALAVNNYTALHIAAKKNNPDVGEKLIESNANVNAQTKAGGAPIHFAVKEGHIVVVKMLHSHNADPEIKSPHGVTPLHLAAQEDRVEAATVLIEEYKVDKDPSTNLGFTPLLTAVYYNNIRIARYLLSVGVNPNAKTKDGYTGLHYATQQGNQQMVKLLLQYQCDPSTVSNSGATAAAIAKRLNFINIYEILNPVTRNKVDHFTPAMESELKKNLPPESIIEGLLEVEPEEEVEIEEEVTAQMQESAFLDPGDLKFIKDDSIGGQTLNRPSNYNTFNRYLTTGLSSRPTSGTSNVSCISAMSYAEGDRFDKLSISDLNKTFLYSTDNQPLTAQSAQAGFLISFVVDAKGAVMRGGRHSGLRIIIPTRRCSGPCRVTCRYMRKTRLQNPPPLVEGEGLAARILEMAPVGYKFNGPVILEIPHFASLSNGEREIVIMKSENGQDWIEHKQDPLEKVIVENLNTSLDAENAIAEEDLNTNRIARIVTSDFPQYFALVTRVKRDGSDIGPDGGRLISTVDPKIHVAFPAGALKRDIAISIQVMKVDPHVVKRLSNWTWCSPIVTIEPRRRKFHKPLRVVIPFAPGTEQTRLRLLRSTAGVFQPAEWSDITGNTMHFDESTCAFETSISARFWLVDTQELENIDAVSRAVYSEAISVPYMAKFVVFAKRHAEDEARVRVFCMTDDSMEKTLENQEQFVEVARSRDVEVLEGRTQYIDYHPSNVYPVLTNNNQHQLNFFAFRENRQGHFVRVHNQSLEPVGRVGFYKDAKVAFKGREAEYENNMRMCSLNVTLPDFVEIDESRPINFASAQVRKQQPDLCDPGLSPNSSYERAMLRLNSIAEHLGADWTLLAEQLNIDNSIVDVIRSQIPGHMPDDLTQQGYKLLHHWAEMQGSNANGPILERALRLIGRDDINADCMGPTFHVKKHVNDDVTAEVEGYVNRFKDIEGRHLVNGSGDA